MFLSRINVIGLVVDPGTLQELDCLAGTKNLTGTGQELDW